MIGPHHLNPNHAQPLFTTVPRDHYDAVCSKLDTVEKECIRIANLYEVEKAKSARLEREIDKILSKLDNPEILIEKDENNDGTPARDRPTDIARMA